MPRILLICPPFSAFTPIEAAVPPLGLARIASIAQKHGEVKVEDMAVKEALGIDSWGHLLDCLATFKPEVIGIGPLVTSNLQKGISAAQIAKSILPDSVIVIGGPDPTFSYEQTLLENPEIDLVFRGESEISFDNFLRIWDKSGAWPELRGIALRLEGKIQSTGFHSLTREEFDTLEIPPWGLFPLDLYAKIAENGNFDPYLPIEGSRGCPLDCIFCACTRLFDSKMKFRSPNSVVSELKSLQQAFGYSKFTFNDDNAGVNRKHLIGLAEAIILSGLQLSLACSTTLDARIFDDIANLQILKNAGFVELFMGCESPHPETIEKVGKTVFPDKWPKKIQQAVELCRSVGIASRTNWILGLPTDTKMKFIETIEFIKKLKPDTALLSILQPYPGTPLAHLIATSPIEVGVFSLNTNPSNMAASRFDPMIETRWMSRDEMIELMYQFLYELSPVLEANISGSPYYLFEKWLDTNN